MTYEEAVDKLTALNFLQRDINELDSIIRSKELTLSIGSEKIVLKNRHHLLVGEIRKYAKSEVEKKKELLIKLQS